MREKPSTANHQHLPRLSPEAYRGHSIVHWTHTIKERKTGWLDSDFHHDFRERLLHTCARYQLACPVYCLMPDHLHLILAGTAMKSDQQNTTKFLRRSLQRSLEARTVRLQRQPYDHVLRDEERGRDGFGTLLHYIFENPVRAKLVNTSKDWPYLGAIIPGYPDLDHQKVDYPEIFWKIVSRLRE